MLSLPFFSLCFTNLGEIKTQFCTDLYRRAHTHYSHNEGQNVIIVTAEKWPKIVIAHNCTPQVAFKNWRIVFLPFPLSRGVVMYLLHSAENSSEMDCIDIDTYEFFSA